MTLDEVQQEVSREVAAGDFVARLAERVGLSARAAAVFGEPVEREGVTVIPVARAAWGFGGGSGGPPESQGAGGGGGGFVTPLGYIEVRDGTAHYVRVRDWRLALGSLGTAVALVALLRRGRR